MVSLREMSLKQLLFLFIAITLLLSGAIYTMHKQGMLPAGTVGVGIVRSIDSMTINDEEQLVIDVTQHPTQQEIDIYLDPDKVEEETGNRPKEPIEITAEKPEYRVSYMLDDATKKELYNLLEVGKVNSGPRASLATAADNCKEKLESNYDSYVENTIMLTNVVDEGWWNTYRDCYALQYAGEAKKTYQSQFTFKQTFRINNEPVTLSTEDTAEEMPEEAFVDGRIEAVNLVDSIGQTQLRDINWIRVGRDDEIWRISSAPSGTKQQFLDSGVMDWIDAWSLFIDSFSTSSDDIENQYQMLLDYNLVESLDEYGWEDEQLSRELKNPEKRVEYQITIDADWVEDVKLREPRPDPRLKNFEIEQDNLKSGYTYTGYYTVCNDREDEKHDGVVRKSLSSEGGYLTSSMSSMTEQIPAGECINGTIDVQALNEQEQSVTDTITLTMSPINLGDYVSESSMSESVTIEPGEGHPPHPDDGGYGEDTYEELTGFFFGQNKKTIGLICMIVSSLMILAGVYIRYGK